MEIIGNAPGSAVMLLDRGLLHVTYCYSYYIIFNIKYNLIHVCLYLQEDKIEDCLLKLENLLTKNVRKISVH